MTDEPETEELAIDWQPDLPASEVYEWASPSGKGGMYIFPKGVEAWADDNGIGLVHIDNSTGEITVQSHIGEPFKTINKPASKLAVVKGKAE